MKKIILSVAVVATAAIAGWNYQQNQNKVEMSDLALANVEALAQGETLPGCNYYVYYDWEGSFGNTHLVKKCAPGGTSCC